jgi:SAM-dependent methyltransferase
MSRVKRALYDRIGASYRATRREDPRIARAIWNALGDAVSVVNVGAGAGAYEPSDREVRAVEPSEVMVAQRPAGSAPVVQGEAEALPFEDDSFDAAMAVLSDHHWRRRTDGMRELRRVARRRVVLFNADPAQAERFWLTRDYLPSFLDMIPAPYRRPGHWAAELASLLGGELRVVPVPIPHDCRDGFYGAYWRRPRSYLDRQVRDGISVFAQLPREAVAAAVERLASDLDDGSWRARHAALLEQDELDLGYALVVVELE